jgi:hypothetical protein
MLVALLLLENILKNAVFNDDKTSSPDRIADCFAFGLNICSICLT